MNINRFSRMLYSTMASEKDQNSWGLTKMIKFLYYQSNPKEGFVQSRDFYYDPENSPHRVKQVFISKFP